MKPFMYLRERVLPAVESAFPVLKEYEELGQRFIERKVGAFATDIRESVETASTFAQKSRGEMRIAALAALHCWWPKEPELLRRCYECGFTDDDVMVRGFAWCIIAWLWRNKTNHSLLKQMTREAMQQRFGVPKEYAMDELIELWLHGIADRVDRLRDRGTLAAVKRGLLEKQAGEDLEAIERGPRAYLTHPDPNLRCAALTILSKDLTADGSVLATFESFVRTDPDVNVRITAAGYYMGFYRATGNRNAERLLAGIVRDRASPSMLRHFAYQGLFSVRDMPLDTWPVVSPTFKFPDDVDWAFVEAYYAEE